MITEIDGDLSLLGEMLPKGSVLMIAGATGLERRTVGGVDVVPLEDMQWWTIVPALERLGRDHDADYVAVLPDAVRCRPAIAAAFPRLLTDTTVAVYQLRFDPTAEPDIPWTFRCNICGAECVQRTALSHPKSCTSCSSNVRYRATVAALSRRIFAADLAISDFERRKDVRVVGIGDWGRYARLLAERLDYTNTFFDSEPRLDLTEPPPAEYVGSCDVVIASDVLEHVAPPIAEATQHLRQMLKPGGVAVVSLPYRAMPGHMENFPQLHRYRLEVRDGQDVLVNERADGTVEEFTDVGFHGARRWLRMRIFTPESFRACLYQAGFASVEFCSRPALQFGVAFGARSPVPVVASVPLVLS